MLSDGPVFVTEPESVVGDSGDRVVIRCLVDSHPPAQYSWFRNDKVRLTQHSEISEYVFIFRWLVPGPR